VTQITLENRSSIPQRYCDRFSRSSMNPRVCYFQKTDSLHHGLKGLSTRFTAGKPRFMIAFVSKGLAGFFVSKGQMIVARRFIAWYPCENGNRPEGHGMIGSERRATIKTTNQSGIRIRPCPTGRILDSTGSSPERAFGPSYDHLVPPGQSQTSPFQVLRARVPSCVPSGPKTFAVRAVFLT
jgi:hypothetical protein